MPDEAWVSANHFASTTAEESLVSGAERSEVAQCIPPARWSVLHVTEAWAGGIGVYVAALIRRQLEDPRVSRITLVCSAERTPSGLEFEDHPKLRIRRYSSSRKPWRVWRSSLAVKRIADDIRPDLVHLHSTFAGVYGRIFKIEARIVYCAHGWAFSQDIWRLVAFAYGFVEAFLARRTNAIIHISQDERRAASRYRVKAPVNRVVLHGVRDPAYSEPPPLLVDSKRINIGFAGRFDRQKGTDTLLEAFKLVKRDDMHLYIAGAFERDRFGSLDVDNPRVTVLGWIDQEQVDSYIRQLDALVIPSRWEGFGLVASEAMRNGKPVIVSHCGGLPEQVVHGYNGLVFPFDEPTALAGLINGLTKEKLAEMGENAKRVWSSSFSEERSYGELMTVYNEVLGLPR